MPNTWRHAMVLLTSGFLAPAGTPAATIERLEAVHTDNRYTLFFEVVLDAEHDRVWQIMTAYQHLPRVSDLIVESHVLTTQGENQHRVAITFRACILFFCKTMKKVVDIEAWPQSDIIAIGDPGLSDFSYSVERWRVSAEGRRTRLRYTAEMVPDFFIPPVIGPWLVESFLQQEIRATAVKVEALAKP